MSGAHFKINQAANSSPTGTNDLTRLDVYKDQPIHLVGDSSAGQASPDFTILSWPDGSARLQPTNNSTFDATFTPDVYGSYRVEFLVDDGEATNRIVRIFAVTKDSAGVVADDSFREPAYGEETGDDNASSNDRGYAKAYEAAARKSSFTVDTVADLRLTKASRFKRARLLAHSTLGDGGGGEFCWDDSSTEADNGGTIIAPTGLATGRWVRQYSDKLHAQWFGAKMDGASDDTLACQAMLDALPSDGGRAHFPGRGSAYKLTSPLTLTGKTNVHITGDGHSSIFQVAKDQQWLLATSVDGLEVSGIMIEGTIDTDGGNTPGLPSPFDTTGNINQGALTLEFCNDVKVHHCRWQNIGGYAIFPHQQNTRVWISECSFLRTMAGVQFGGGAGDLNRDIFILDNFFLGFEGKTVSPTQKFLGSDDQIACFGAIAGSISICNNTIDKQGGDGHSGTFTVNTSTNVCASAGHELLDDDPVVLTNSGGGLPAPFAITTTYYVINVVAGVSFQLAETLGGSAIDITTAGTGAQTFHRGSALLQARGIDIDTDTGLFVDGLQIVNNRVRNVRTWHPTFDRSAVEIIQESNVAPYRNFIVSGNIIQNCNRGLWIYGPSTNDLIINANIISGVHTDTSFFTSANGIEIENSTVKRALISKNIIEDCDKNGIFLGHTQYITVEGNSIRATGEAGILGNQANLNLIVKGNQISAAGTHGIFVGNPTTSKVDIDGNIVDSCAYGITLTSISKLGVRGNIVATTTAGKCIDIESCTDFDVIGNKCTGSASAGCFLLSYTRATVLGNTFVGNTTYGLELAGVSPSGKFIGNNLVGNTTAAVLDSTTGSPTHNWIDNSTTLTEIDYSANAHTFRASDRTTAPRLDVGAGAAGGVVITSHAGTPEASVTADLGALCLDSTNGALYFKHTGSNTNTGWVKLLGTGLLDIVNTDVDAAAGIVYSKLNLASSITSGDIVNGTIVDADLNASAAVAVTKLAAGSDGQVLQTVGGAPTWETSLRLGDSAAARQNLDIANRIAMTHGIADPGVIGYSVLYVDGASSPHLVFHDTNDKFEPISNIIQRGADLTNADQTLSLSGGSFYVLPAATALTTNRTKTLGLTGAAAGFRIRIRRWETSVNTMPIVDGGPGTPTIFTFPGSGASEADFYFNGTNWLLVGAWIIQ